VPTDDQ
jgi:hypothetical protein